MGFPLNDSVCTIMVFADDIVLVATSVQHMQIMAREVEGTLLLAGLEVQAEKTVIAKNSFCERRSIELGGIGLKDSTELMILGCVVDLEGECTKDVIYKIKQGWKC
jgi:hypothetical protein